MVFALLWYMVRAKSVPCRTAERGYSVLYFNFFRYRSYVKSVPCCTVKKGYFVSCFRAFAVRNLLRKQTALRCKSRDVVVRNWFTMGQKVDSHGSQSGLKVAPEWPESGPKAAPMWARGWPRGGQFSAGTLVEFFREILLTGRSISGLAFWAMAPYNDGIQKIL